jgi:hypothetical protein
VRELFRKGVAAFKAKNHDEARTRLLEAWTIRQTPDVAAMLGQVELRLERYRDAAEHLDYALRNVPAAESDAFIEKVRTGFEKAKVHVTGLRISVNKPGAEVLIDGRAVGMSPINQVIFIEPGEHVVEAKLNGVSGSDPINADAGKETSAEVTLPGVPAATRAQPAPVAQPIARTTPHDVAPLPPPVPYVPPAQSRRSLAPVIVGGVVFAAGIGTGVGLRLAGSSKHDTVNTLSSRVGVGGCANGSGSQSDCAALLDAARSFDRYRNWSTAGFVVAGAALVATSVYWFWPRSSSRDRATSVKSLRIDGYVANGAQGFSVAGEF